MARIRKTGSADEGHFWKVALYIRLSKEDGNDESLSVGNQRNILYEYVREQFKEGYTITDVYTDDGKSGTDVNRPDFMRMEQDIKSGKVNCVIVKSLARAFRNLGDQQKYLEEIFPLHGVRFINLGTPFIDTFQNPRATLGLEVPIYGMFNEQFAASTSEEVRKTFNTKRRKGEFIGAFAPYGYKKHPEDKNRLMIDEEAAGVVRDIFFWFLYGPQSCGRETSGSLSISGIAKELNERGLPCPAAYKKQQGLKYQNPHNRYKDCYWSGSSVSRILRDRVYTGCMVQGKFRVISYKIHKQIKTPEREWFIVPNRHEPIIEQCMFDEVQHRLERDMRVAPGKKEVYLFSGLLRCADCGRSLHRKASKNFVYYFCRTPQRAKNACTKRSVRSDVLETIALQILNMQIALTEDMAQITGQISSLPKSNEWQSRLYKMLQHHELERVKLMKMSDGLYADWKNNDITREEYLRLKSGYTDRLRETVQVIKKIRENCDDAVLAGSAEHPCLLALREFGSISELRRDMLIALLDTICLHEDGGLTIQFTFADPYQKPANRLINERGHWLP